VLEKGNTHRRCSGHGEINSQKRRLEIWQYGKKQIKI